MDTDSPPSRPDSGGQPAKQATAKPAAAKPAAAKPGTSKPATGQPATGQPATAQPAKSPTGNAPAKAAVVGAATVGATSVGATAPAVAAGRTPVTVDPAPALAPSPPVAPRAEEARTSSLDPRMGSGTTSTPAAPARPSGPRRARLLVTRIDPWSVMKMAFMLAISAGIVILVATGLLWWTLDVTGVFATVGRTIDDVAGSSTTSFDFLSLVSFNRVMGIALVLTAIEIVLWSALATLVAFLYNLSVGLTGGLEVTLSEDA